MSEGIEEGLCRGESGVLWWCTWVVEERDFEWDLLWEVVVKVSPCLRGCPLLRETLILQRYLIGIFKHLLCSRVPSVLLSECSCALSTTQRLSLLPFLTLFIVSFSASHAALSLSPLLTPSHAVPIFYPSTVERYMILSSTCLLLTSITASSSPHIQLCRYIPSSHHAQQLSPALLAQPEAAFTRLSTSLFTSTPRSRNPPLFHQRAPYLQHSSITPRAPPSAPHLQPRDSSQTPFIHIPHTTSPAHIHIHLPFPSNPQTSTRPTTRSPSPTQPPTPARRHLPPPSSPSPRARNPNPNLKAAHPLKAIRTAHRNPTQHTEPKGTEGDRRRESPQPHNSDLLCPGGG